MELPAFVRFASDATLVGLWAGGFLLLAVIATIAEARRNRRKNLHRVGWVPWTPIFLGSAFIGSGLMLVAIKGWLTG